MKNSGGLCPWSAEKQVVRRVADFQVLDRQGNKGGVCLVLEQSQVETCQDSGPMSQEGESKKLSTSADG